MVSTELHNLLAEPEVDVQIRNCVDKLAEQVPIRRSQAEDQREEFQGALGRLGAWLPGTPGFFDIPVQQP